MHHRDQNGLGTNLAGDVASVDNAVGVHWNLRDLDTGSGKVTGGLKQGRMFDCSRNNVPGRANGMLRKT